MMIAPCSRREAGRLSEVSVSDVYLGLGVYLGFVLQIDADTNQASSK
jgi:hypothetical protein